MIRNQIIFLLIIFSFTISHGQSSIDEIRTTYFNAIENKEEAKKLNTRLKERKENSPLITGYLGASHALLGKHAWNPHEKWKELQKGLKLLKESIEQQPDDIELRFLRFSILFHLPSFLGFAEEEKKDKEVILNNLYNNEVNNKPSSVIKVIVNFFLQKEIGNREKLIIFIQPN